MIHHLTLNDDATNCPDTSKFLWNDTSPLHINSLKYLQNH